MSQKQSEFHQYIKEQNKARRRQSSSSVPVKKITQPPKSIQTSEVVQILPPKNLSLKQLHESELQLAKKSIFDKNTSFKQLFVKRMSQLQKKNDLGPSKKTNIKINVYMSSEDSQIRKVTYGPFTYSVPQNLSINDKYKYLMYTLLRKDFQLNSLERISGLGG